MGDLIGWFRRFSIRAGEIGGTVLALLATYEAVFADRVAPTLRGGFSLCEVPQAAHHQPREVLFDFLRLHADRVAYLDIYVTPIDREVDAGGCPEGQDFTTGDHGMRAAGPMPVFADGSSGATPELVIEYDAFTTPQTARLTGQSGEEPIFGVRGLVYIEEGELDMGYQAFALGAAPYDADMLKTRDCTHAYTEATGALARLSAYMFKCIGN